MCVGQYVCLEFDNTPLIVSSSHRIIVHSHYTHTVHNNIWNSIFYIANVNQSTIIIIIIIQNKNHIIIRMYTGINNIGRESPGHENALLLSAGYVGVFTC